MTQTLELWGARRVAEALGISKRAVWRAAREGRIPSPLPIEGDDWICVWDADAIRRFLARSDR